MATPHVLFALALAALAASGPAAAQYKVVAPDGSVTYTDRPPATSQARISALSTRGGGATPVDASLPFELRQVAGRFPVVLYSAADCTPCDSGRQWLQQRGIPYIERRIAPEDDLALLERAVGGRTVPALTVGTQALRGFAQAEWASYLDAAGYPRESRLPRNWQPPAPQPLGDRPQVAAPPAAPASAATPAPVPEPPPAEGGFKF